MTIELDRPTPKLTRKQQQEARKLAQAVTQVAELAAAAQPTNAPTVMHRVTRDDLARSARDPDVVLTQGRPSTYTQTEGDEICAWVQAGGSMRGYCKVTGRAPVTLYRWMREHAGFGAQYTRAHEDRADTLTDEMLEIADEAAGENASIEGVAAAKLRVETRKWIASKLRPQRWGDKQVVEHVGAVSIRIGIPSKQTTTDMVDVVDVGSTLLSR